MTDSTNEARFTGRGGYTAGSQTTPSTRFVYGCSHRLQKGQDVIILNRRGEEEIRIPADKISNIEPLYRGGKHGAQIFYSEF